MKQLPLLMKHLFSSHRYLFSFLALASSGGVVSAAPQLHFSGENLPVLSVDAERNTGLDNIYVVYDTNGVEFSYEASDISRVKIYKFSNLGGAYAEEITDVERSYGKVTVKNVAGNHGYIVEDGDYRYYYWLVEYKDYRLKVSKITPSDEQVCEYVSLDVVGEGEPIHYYTINGQQKVLDREIRVTFDTQEWNEESGMFVAAEAYKMYEYLSHPLIVTPPSYCATYYTLTGDRFLEAWNWGISVESEVIQPKAVAVRTTATQDGESTDATEGENSAEVDENGDIVTEIDTEDESNIIRGDSDALGDSAPSEITFTAYATDGVIHHEWQMSQDPEFDTVDYRFNQQTLDYTFTEEGTFYLRYIGSNDDGSCEAIGDTYTVSIGASELLCPNAFTPDGDGVNDVWKVAYRSLLDFKCWIFDRYGAQIYYFEDPTQGWDGTRHGKTVKPGVYYYVIQAEGADGKKYKKSGDINIIRHRNATSTADGDSVAE